MFSAGGTASATLTLAQQPVRVFETTSPPTTILVLVQRPKTVQGVQIPAAMTGHLSRLPA